MKRSILFFCLLGLACLGVQAQDFRNADEWQAYDDFNNVFLCRQKQIYRTTTKYSQAVDRWNGAAAIWCQAIYYDMAINAYRRAVAEGGKKRIGKYRSQASAIYNGMKAQYADFNFHDCNTNTGWFVYDDIMWWTIAFARAAQFYGTLPGKKAAAAAKENLAKAEESFQRVWYGSPAVGDDGSYADPGRGLGGGMFWEWQPIDKPKPHRKGDFRSACINFPTVIAACLLHELQPEAQENYLAKAQEIYDWAQKTLAPSNGRVADGIHGGGPEYTDHLYNQATFIGASCMLYKLTGDEAYLRQATQGADYVFGSMAIGSQKYLPYETGPEQGIYTAIFAQYISMLLKESGKNLDETKRQNYLRFIRNNLQAGWKNRDSRGINNGRLHQKQTDEAEVDSYSAAALPALMLLFPAEDFTPADEN